MITCSVSSSRLLSNECQLCDRWSMARLYFFTWWTAILSKVCGCLWYFMCPVVAVLLQFVQFVSGCDGPAAICVRLRMSCYGIDLFFCKTGMDIFCFSFWFFSCKIVFFNDKFRSVGEIYKLHQKWQLFARYTKCDNFLQVTPKVTTFCHLETTDDHHTKRSARCQVCVILSPSSETSISKARWQHHRSSTPRQTQTKRSTHTNPAPKLTRATWLTQVFLYVRE